MCKHNFYIKPVSTLHTFCSAKIIYESRFDAFLRINNIYISIDKINMRFVTPTYSPV
jgi:hypothetical protein